MTARAQSPTLSSEPNNRRAIRAALSAYNTMKAAEAAYDSAFRSAYPSGAPVCWMHGDYLQTGEVVMHGRGRVKVFNISTEREVWLDRSRIRL
jgi:hypothetical protein